MIGRVVSVKMKNTAAVLVEARKQHPLYKKSFLRSKKYLADDQLGVDEGDIVEIIKVAPISRHKHWKITKVVGKDLVALGEQKMAEAAQEAIAQVMPEEDKEQIQEVAAEAITETEDVKATTKKPVSRKTAVKKGLK